MVILAIFLLKCVSIVLAETRRILRSGMRTEKDGSLKEGNPSTSRLNVLYYLFRIIYLLNCFFFLLEVVKCTFPHIINLKFEKSVGILVDK